MFRKNTREDDIAQQHIETDTNIPEGPVNEYDAVVPVDAALENKYGSVQNAYEEGFAASSGVRNLTAETDGAVQSPETGDEDGTNQTRTSVDLENAGLAES